MSHSMRHIRPYKIFTSIDSSPLERIVHVPLPRRRGVGRTSLLEIFRIEDTTLCVWPNDPRGLILPRLQIG